MVNVMNGSVQALRRGNRERLIGLLRDRGPMHRAELARQAGVSRTTVSNIVADLLEEKLIEPVESSEKIGRGSGLLALSHQLGFLAGMDFSLGAVSVVVTDLSQRVVAEESATLDLDHSAEDQLEAGAAILRRLAAAQGVTTAELVGVGLGVPAMIDQESGAPIGAGVGRAPWSNVDAAAELSSRIDTPVVAENTTRLFALAESARGVAADVADVVYVKLSYGVGSALILDNSLYRGSLGSAGELGHVTIDHDGPLCRCGGRGCLQVYAGGVALLAALAEVRGHEVDFPELIEAVNADDRVAIRLVEDAASATGRALGNVCNLLNPSMIVVAGELAEAGTTLLESLSTALQRTCTPAASRRLQIVPSQLGLTGGALGGVALIASQQLS